MAFTDLESIHEEFAAYSHGVPRLKAVDGYQFFSRHNWDTPLDHACAWCNGEILGRRTNAVYCSALCKRRLAHKKPRASRAARPRRQCATCPTLMQASRKTKYCDPCRAAVHRKQVRASNAKRRGTKLCACCYHEISQQRCKTAHVRYCSSACKSYARSKKIRHKHTGRRLCAHCKTNTIPQGKRVVTRYCSKLCSKQAWSAAGNAAAYVASGNSARRQAAWKIAKLAAGYVRERGAGKERGKERWVLNPVLAVSLLEAKLVELDALVEAGGPGAEAARVQLEQLLKQKP